MELFILQMLYLRLEKCKFEQEEVKYLRLIIY
jgi:hypothetical protein